MKLKKDKDLQEFAKDYIYPFCITSKNHTERKQEQFHP